jgi:hypothetical protein
MSIPSAVVRFTGCGIGAAGIGGVAFVLILWATRLGPPSAVFQATLPEVVLACGLALVFFAVALWRLLRHSSLKAEASAFVDAALGDDHLG